MKMIIAIRSLNKTTVRAILLAAATLLLIGAFAGLFYLAETYPFQPGDALYGLQNTAEQTRLKFTVGALSSRSGIPRPGGTPPGRPGYCPRSGSYPAGRACL